MSIFQNSSNRVKNEMSATADNTVFVVRYAHQNARLRLHFTNTDTVRQNMYIIDITD